ncbi:MAG TPA: alpha-L-arabinofuranosidase C-terminal domain-containing protein [Opitutaceae bacterium]|nr:alpha-L-arabinofuranosidase C-terminal domain-containing protein [Opitutaceae bacterium]
MSTPAPRAHRPGALRLFTTVLALTLTASAVAATTLTIDTRGPGKPISPDLFGIFFEDLNYAADGGLYAELIQNRSFEYNATEQPTWTPLTSWETITRGGAAGVVRVSTAAPLNANNSHYVALTVKKPGGGYGLANAGYDGIPVQGGDGYVLSFFAHQLFMGEQWSPQNTIAGRPMPVVVQLEAPNGDVLASASFEVSGRPWQKYSATLTPAHPETAARLVLLAHAQGGVALDEISLFPVNTFHHRPNGMRADLAQVIADLHPKFVRFPGGCLSHGDGLDNIYRWKDTIGPVEQRKGQRNLWGYHQSVGLGFYEYFQFCEDIGAQPLPVVAAGVCCQNSDNSPGMGQAGIPLADMPAYVQDILDLIEWANGPSTSPWGAKRAAAGHPAPFGLKYLGVGNEDQITPVFRARFKMIYDAVKAKHPEIEIVGTAGPFPDGEDFDKGWAFAKQLRIPYVDEHYYRPPAWFWSNLHRYDRYDRSGPEVYVGEYAAHDTGRRNTLRSALAEAAGMTGFERNGDVVHLASYAPLLARRGHTQWHPDMIYFTGTAVYPTPNYTVQRLFMTNSGDTELSATAEAAPAEVAVSAVRDSRTGDVILKIVNGGAACPITIHWRGLADGPHPATETVLASDNPDAVNRDGEPPAATPVTRAITLDPTFPYTAPANSLTILRLGGR